MRRSVTRRSSSSPRASTPTTPKTNFIGLPKGGLFRMEAAMAQATTIKGGKVRVKIGNNATPIVYTAPCGFTQRSITLTKNLNEVSIPDCENPDKVDWI